MKSQYVSVLVSAIVYSALFHFVNSDFFTAIADMEKLLNTEEEIVKTLENYLKIEEERLEKVKRLTNHYGKLHRTVKLDAESFLTNPLNAYLLIKRLSTDWKAAHKLFNGSEAKAVIQNETLKELHFPNNEDMEGAAAALVRLQEIYLLDAESISKGLLKGNPPTYELTAGDCFEVGKKAFDVGQFNFSLQWMEGAMRKLKEDNAEFPKVTEVLEYMAFSASMLKNFTFAVELTEYLIELEPDHPRAYRNIYYYKQLMEEGESNTAANGNNDLLQEIAKPARIVFEENDELDPYVRESYQKLCRGESIKTPSKESKLTCYMSTRSNSYLLLQPVKVEVLSIKPRIVIYHDVVDDKEADVIKKLASPKLERARVYNETTGEQIAWNYRISKSAWLGYKKDPLLSRLSQRVQAITGLDIATAEPLQVVNYGIGGHYEPHHDYIIDEAAERAFGKSGNRLATWIAYLSDVPAGGSTVFPLIGVEVKPRKGSAAFWYNLHGNGSGDVDTMHAACPVLAGTKWVSNTWYHEFEFPALI